ncbi:TPA: hypothetical protein ACSTQA_001746 [Staphylococcus aureus]
MTEVKIKTISGEFYFAKIRRPFEDYVKGAMSCNGYIYAENLIKQVSCVKANAIESITLIEERGK